MNHALSLRTAAALCLLLVICLGPAFADAVVDGQFILDRPTVVLGEPSWLTFRLVNRSTAPIRFFEAVGRGSVQRSDYDFTAFDAAGHVVNPPIGMVISGPAHLVSVASGETYRQRLFLPDWLTLRKPGVYTLRCKRPLSSTILAQSDVVLSVAPPDTQALGRVIQSLAGQTRTGSLAAQDEAALSLSEIPDQRVIPVLAALLTRPDPSVRLNDAEQFLREDSKFSAVNGLAHFSSDASAKALLPALSGSDEDLRSAAGHALTEMRYADRVLPALRQELRSPVASVRVTALHAVAALQDPRGFLPLVSALHDPVPTVREEAAKALGTLRDRRAVPVLKSHLKDPNLTLRLACIESLVPLKYPILTQWLTPIVRSYAYPGHQYPSLAAMLALRLDCDDRAAPALAGCLNFDDPRPSNSYNFFLIYQMDACASGPKYSEAWIGGGMDTLAALENNRKILAAIKRRLAAR